MKRELFSQEHEIFRDAFRKFLEKEVIPHREEWEKQGMVSREVWKKAGEAGFLLPWIPEEYGGMGADFLYSVVIIEELAYAMESGFAIALHNDVVAPYIYYFGNEEQKKRWLPPAARGEKIFAVAMTEPDAGSDLQRIKTTAIRDGDYYILNGTKMFITNGLLADVVVVAAKTNPDADPPYTGVSLLVVERGMEGFKRGRKIPKMGMWAQDTAELIFEDVKVPVENLLGEEGAGFYYLMKELQQERLVVAIGAVAAAEKAFEITKQYLNERHAFGRPLKKFQYIRFKMAELATEIALGREFVDRLIREHMKGEDVVVETSMAKWWTTEMLKRVVDWGVQFHGGYGYTLEYPISKAFLDARVQTIYAGTTEIMKEIISRRIL